MKLGWPQASKKSPKGHDVTCFCGRGTLPHFQLETREPLSAACCKTAVFSNQSYSTPPAIHPPAVNKDQIRLLLWSLFGPCFGWAVYIGLGAPSGGDSPNCHTIPIGSMGANSAQQTPTVPNEGLRVLWVSQTGRFYQAYNFGPYCTIPYYATILRDIL